MSGNIVVAARHPLRYVAAIAVALLVLSAPSFAAPPGHWPAGFWSYPTFKNIGPVHRWPEDTFIPNRTDLYKAVIDVTKESSPDKVAKPIAGVARMVNAFTLVGVPVDHLRFVVVVHALATPDILNNAAYRAKFHVDNPNIPVLEELHKAGIQLTVCGQALADNDYKPSDVVPYVKPVLGAMPTLIMLQDKGYALIRF